MNEGIQGELETLQAFFAKHAGDCRLLSAYLRLDSDMGLPEVAAVLGRMMGIKFREARDCDEYDAYRAEIGDHEVTLLLPARAMEERYFEIMIEPGWHCQAEGDPIDLTDRLVEWLREGAGEVGRFEAIG